MENAWGGGKVLQFIFVPESPVWNHSIAIELADKVLFALKIILRI